MLRAAVRGWAAKLNTQLYEKYSCRVGTYACMHLILQYDQDSWEWEKDADLTPAVWLTQQQSSTVMFMSLQMPGKCHLTTRDRKGAIGPRGHEAGYWWGKARYLEHQAGIQDLSGPPPESESVFHWCNTRAHNCLSSTENHRWRTGFHSWTGECVGHALKVLLYKLIFSFTLFGKFYWNDLFNVFCIVILFIFVQVRNYMTLCTLPIV